MSIDELAGEGLNAPSEIADTGETDEDFFFFIEATRLGIPVKG